MKISTQKMTWMSLGCVFALLTGIPALADDTELMLINPDPSSDPTPNVMFILDTSGSMDDELSTTEPYDGSTTYTGDCDSDVVYWTDVDVVPSCDAANENWVNKSAFFCQYATDQMSGIGSYTNTMVQYRDGGKDGGGSGPARWQYLATGYHDAPVECQADSGIHGDGRADYLWAANGTDLADPWTNNSNNELSWGSAPRNIGYTLYDGNYLNWKNNPTTVMLSKMEILKSVTKQVLSSVHNLNVGIMRFNPNVGSGMSASSNGGSVIQGLTDLDTNRTMILNTIDSLPADGFTPLSETMYENALYWHSLASHFGTAALTDSGALAGGGSAPGTYETHEWDSCAKNFNILVTDGLPTQDTDTPGLLGNLPGMAATCDGTAGDGQCLDDVAGYLNTHDVDSGTAGDQLVITHTIGYNVNLPILQETATDGGGDYFQANDVESLTETLLDIIANINDRSLSFSAPAVSVNTFNRTQNLNDLYITMFGAKSKVHWPGNLKKYRIVDGTITDSNGAAAVDPTTGFFVDTAQSYWTGGGPDGNDVMVGGAAAVLPLPASRKLYTNNTSGDLSSATNAISTANLGALNPADFGLTGATGEPSLSDLINWARGDDSVRNEDNNVATTVRYAMGDPLHSQPAAIVYGGSAASPDVVVYVATNDGYLHAINGSTGIELWSFIPKQLLSSLERLYFNSDSRYKQYGIDGSVVPVIKDVNQNGTIEPTDGDFVQLIFGMRRGGNTLFSIDVTNRNAPVLLWDVSLPDFGETWSTPVVAKIKLDPTTVTQNGDDAVVVIGGGYDTVHDTATFPASADGVGAGVYFLDLKTGDELWHAGRDAGADLQLASMTRAIPNEVRVIDLSGDGYADRMYATDLGGQILRFDISNGKDASNLVTGGVIAQLGAEGLGSPTAGDTRRFYNAPDVALITDKFQQRKFLAINVGSGYRAHPFDLSATDRFYSLRDGDVFNQLDQNAYQNYDIAKDGDFIEVSGATQSVVTSSDRGWKFTLPANQKILADSLTFNDQVFFVAFSPDSNAAASCAVGQGTNFLYRVNILNGDPIVPNIGTLDPADSDDARRTTLAQGGIAPTPSILFPAPDPDCTGDDCGQPPLGCVGVECFDPGFQNVPVRTLWTQDGIQ
jgi:type IV pilus assembly protein PilY1